MRLLIFCTLVLAAASTAAAQDSKVIARGAGVYKEQRCAMCHSIAGTGNKNGSLDGVGSRLNEADMRAWMVDAPGMTLKSKSTRKPLMKSYTLPAADLDALVAYMMSLKVMPPKK